MLHGSVRPARYSLATTAPARLPTALAASPPPDRSGPVARRLENDGRAARPPLARTARPRKPHILPPLLMRHRHAPAPRLPLPEGMNNSFAAQMPLPVMTTGRFIRVRIAWSLLATIHTDDHLCGSCKGHPSVVVAVPAGEPRMYEQLVHSEYIAHHEQLWTLMMLTYGVGTAGLHSQHIQSLWG